jgi:ABC-type phosphate transport system substrate-binding protein
MGRTMKNLKCGFLVLVNIALASALTAGVSGVKIIANSTVKADSISAEELRRIFLEETNSLSDGSRVEPVVARGGAAHEVFAKEYVGKSDAALQTYYRCLVFTGKGSLPKMVNSETEMMDYVAKTKGAIGYSSAGTNTDGLKILQVK